MLVRATDTGRPRALNSTAWLTVVMKIDDEDQHGLVEMALTSWKSGTRNHHQHYSIVIIYIALHQCWLCPVC